MQLFYLFAHIFINFGCKDNDSLRQKMSQPKKNESKRENNGIFDYFQGFIGEMAN